MKSTRARFATNDLSFKQKPNWQPAGKHVRQACDVWGISRHHPSWPDCCQLASNLPEATTQATFLPSNPHLRYAASDKQSTNNTDNLSWSSASIKSMDSTPIEQPMLINLSWRNQRSLILQSFDFVWDSQVSSYTLQQCRHCSSILSTQCNDWCIWMQAFHWTKPIGCYHKTWEPNINSWYLVANSCRVSQ